MGERKWEKKLGRGEGMGEEMIIFVPNDDTRLSAGMFDEVSTKTVCRLDEDWMLVGRDVVESLGRGFGRVSLGMIRKVKRLWNS